jgi:hypothetical protein
MNTIAIRARDRNRSEQLELFSWRETSPSNASRVTLNIAKRFGISLDHASTIARLAGIGGSHHES